MTCFAMTALEAFTGMCGAACCDKEYRIFLWIVVAGMRGAAACVQHWLVLQGNFLGIPYIGNSQASGGGGWFDVKRMSELQRLKADALSGVWSL
jgi:hypothetical protein